MRKASFSFPIFNSNFFKYNNGKLEAKEISRNLCPGCNSGGLLSAC